MKKLVPVLAALLLAVLGAGCATTRAQTPAEKMPALDVPPVPPRVIEPAPPLPPPQLAPVDELPTAPPPATSKPRLPPRESPKPEPKPEPPVTEQPPVNAAPNAPTVPPLRTARTVDSVQAERQVKDIIGRANGLLGRVDYQRLTNDRQKAYNEAKQFIQQADAAIKDGRFEYALELADKAEQLAKGLQS